MLVPINESKEKIRDLIRIMAKVSDNMMKNI